jgi:hypothetical protein
MTSLFVWFSCVPQIIWIKARVMPRFATSLLLQSFEANVLRLESSAVGTFPLLKRLILLLQAVNLKRFGFLSNLIKLPS